MTLKLAGCPCATAAAEGAVVMVGASAVTRGTSSLLLTRPASKASSIQAAIKK